MPNYSFQNKETNEQFEASMPWVDLDPYLKENPNIKQIFVKFPGFVDPYRLGRMKPDDGFRDVLRNVQHHHKKDSINTW
tara:strand:+ start:5597 stop:5833 length:237 start_codon:yes stop_codon:yes gene_type:complete